MSKEFCDKYYGKKEFSKSLYNVVGEKTSDISVISDNLYTSYALLFIVLGVILTIALVAALSLLKGAIRLITMEGLF
jgi:NADH:ubiquinone oxidoreductase subunit 6 (subunit J)